MSNSLNDIVYHIDMNHQNDTNHQNDMNHQNNTNHQNNMNDTADNDYSYSICSVLYAQFYMLNFICSSACKSKVLNQ